MDAWVTNLVETMFRYIGQTVTIFTTSGGLSGRPDYNKIHKSTIKINSEFVGFSVNDNLFNQAANGHLFIMPVKITAC